uniref:NIDO domain-containing protein n=1 Tax=Timema monikensis TaxID=170555 RepID=A0A7R9HNQ8_9NEOP|nr:unnamed protein product [Timema monikensis]
MARPALWLLVLVTCAQVCRGIPKELLYPHGPGIDTNLARDQDDAASPEITLLVPIVFYGEAYNAIYERRRSRLFVWYSGAIEALFGAIEVLWGLLSPLSNHPTKETTSPLSNHPTKETTSPLSNHPTKETTSPLSNHPTKETTSPLSNHPTKETTSPLSNHPTKETISPLSNHPTKETTSPLSNHPTKRPPDKTTRAKQRLVNSNGLLSFLTEIPSFFNIQFPLDYPVIAPLYTNVDTRGSGTVYYRETQDPSLLERASDAVRESFSSAADFTATSLFIATWDNVGYYNRGSDKVQSEAHRNNLT